MDYNYIIGIDLGTTNSAVSYVDLRDEQIKTKDDKKKLASRIRIFNVPQMTEAGEINALPILPSFLYIPGKYDLPENAVTIPWRRKEEHFAGTFARDHGAKVPDRLVSSAKSWLCHSGVDRHAKILPWGSGDGIDKVSPVNATASYLEHVRLAWNHSKKDNEDLYLENQMVIITVPASFDEVARDLTINAAKDAGYKKVTLIEEPLAAFYSWLIKYEKEWADHVKTNELILVCDVGGGTTDFTLIYLRDVDGSPRFERIAVGDHLMLGGDNIDLEMARFAEGKLGKAHGSLSKDKWKSLCYQCRQAKENILDRGEDSARIILMGEGSSLIGGTMSTRLAKEDVERIVLDGFFPDEKRVEETVYSNGKTITEFGLPYEKEKAITKHVGWFLDKHGEDVKRLLEKIPMPDLILFNGGSLKPQIIQDKIRAGIRSWFDVEDQEMPRVLDNPDLDLAVALGATYYGLVKSGIGVKVGSGSARSYYLGIGGNGGKKEALCVVERGLDEGSRIELSENRFEVLANKPVGFDIYSSSFRAGDRAGDIINVDDTMTALPPLNTLIKFGKKENQTTIPVGIEAEYTEMGTLAVWCKSKVSDHRWQLQFQLRDSKPVAGVEVTEEEIFDDAIIQQIKDVVAEAMAKDATRDIITGINKRIEKILERPRNKWPLSVIRMVSDELIKSIEARKISKDHESKWMNLLGFSMRPGFGDGFDAQRVKGLWKIYKQGTAFPSSPQVASDWWIMWRRVAGGLTPGQQRQFFQDISSILITKKNSKAKISPQERLELWMAVANMERLLVKDKVKIGKSLLDEIKPKKVVPQMLWALSRLGARELLYGSVDRVIPPAEVAGWIETLLSKNWKDPQPVAMALAQMARKTGDHARDLPPELIGKISVWMSSNNAPARCKKMITEIVEVESQERSSMFGESLPSGLMVAEN